MARLLARWGMSVSVAHGEEAAVNLARRFRPSFVIMSLELPELDSPVAIPEFRDKGRCHDSTFIGVSFGEEWDSHRCHEAGFQHWFVTPVNLAELRHILTSARN